MRIRASQPSFVRRLGASSRPLFHASAALGALLLAGCGGGGGSGTQTASGDVVVAAADTVTPAPTPTPTAAADATAAAAKPRSMLGINVARPTYSSGERIFANLLIGLGWKDKTNDEAFLDASQLDSYGNVRFLNAGQVASRMLTQPAAALAGGNVKIRCTWIGSGKLDVKGKAANIVKGDHSAEFDWPVLAPSANGKVWVELRTPDANDPVRNVDCREKGASTSDLFASEFIDSIRGYGVLRFLDWGQANNNPDSVTWAARTLPGSADQGTVNGAAIETMVALAKQVDADMWLNVPWNADEDYVRRMAQTVHDTLPANRSVYVEMSNEVWNGAFPVADQAASEGLAEGLSTNTFQAQMRRYAEKSVWMLKIWSQVFADRPGKLVRVVSTQNGNSWTAEQVLAFKDTASNVDALATAPYFGRKLLDGAKATDSVDMLMTQLGKQMNDGWADVQENADVAKKYGKRYLAYEAGQHVISTTLVDLLSSVNRNPRMYDIYTSYLSTWRQRYGDVMMLYSATGFISKSGAWGLREYSGQPMDQTPKRRAAMAMLSQN